MTRLKYAIIGSVIFASTLPISANADPPPGFTYTPAPGFSSSPAPGFSYVPAPGFGPRDHVRAAMTTCQAPTPLSGQHIFLLSRR